MKETVEISVEGGLATWRLSRKHGNAINPRLVAELGRAIDETQRDPSIRGVLLCGSGKLFSPGLDLRELVELDRGEMLRFFRSFLGVVRDLYSFPRPLVAAVTGHAVAGGCVLAQTADWVVLGEEALIGLNEVAVGVPLPFLVTMILHERVPSMRRTEVALLGRNYRGAAALETGLAHEIAPRDRVEESARERLGELADKPAPAFAMTKSYLRSQAVARAEAYSQQVDEFLDIWFAEETRARVESLVRRLES